ncbi:hypothetical protein [Azospirillum endophyticum]
MTTLADRRYAGYRCPAEVMATAGWPYFRWFCQVSRQV